MLGKLIKHEWRAFWKIPAFVSLFLAIFTVFGVIALNAKIWETENPVIQSLSVFVLMFYYIAIIVISFVSILYTALRFYKNMYSDEGYLMHTLPVTQKSLIFSKLIVSYAWTIIIGLVIICSVFTLLFALISSTGMDVTFFDLISQMIDALSNSGFLEEFKELFGFGFVHFLILMLVFCILAPIYSILMIYTSISLGQLFKKHKVLGSILSYIGIYVVLQIIGSFVSAPVMFSSAELENFTTFGPMLYFYLAEMIALSIVFFFVTEFIMKKKLNLD